MSHFSETLNKKKNKILSAYARLRIRPTKQESRTYNTTDRILLTFDDYADQATVTRFLEILDREKIKAIFFLIGEWAKKNPDIVNAIEAAGHWVGNHTYSHLNLAKLSSTEIENEIKETIKGSSLLRPPYGVYDNRIRKIAESIGYRIAFWTIDSDDWKGITASQIQTRVFENLHPGACVLMHLNAPHTLEALPGLIKGIRDRGFLLCTEGNEISSR